MTIVIEAKEMLSIIFCTFWVRVKPFLSILPEMPSHVQIIGGVKFITTVKYTAVVGGLTVAELVNKSRQEL